MGHQPSLLEQSVMGGAGINVNQKKKNDSASDVHNPIWIRQLDDMPHVGYGIGMFFQDCACSNICPKPLYPILPLDSKKRAQGVRCVEFRACVHGC